MWFTGVVLMVMARGNSHGNGVGGGMERDDGSSNR